MDPSDNFIEADLTVACLPLYSERLQFQIGKPLESRSQTRNSA